MALFDRFARWIAPRIVVDEKQIAGVKTLLATAQSEVVYVVRRPSYLETALLKQVLSEHALPVPKGILDPFRDSNVSSVGTTVAALRWRTGYELSLGRVRRYRQVLTAWLDRKREDRVRYVPVSLFAGLGPRPWPGHSFWPIDFDWLPLGDFWLLWVYWFQRKTLSIDIGPPIDAEPRQTGGEFQTRLSQEIYRKEKVARGAQTQAIQTVENIVLSGEQFEEVLLELATTTSASRTQLYRRARKYLRRLSAHFRGSVIYFLYLVVHPVIKAVFSSVRVHNLDSLKELTARHPVVLLPSHRSHFDYVLMSYILYKANLPIPYVAAGVNLNFWPFGSLARGAGAFFIRRSIENDPLYKRVLDNYMSYLTKHGDMLEFFIEGGRSRTGAMRKPRLGLLKYLIRGWEQGGRDDLLLIPIGITYERLAEEKALQSELVGGKKRKENLFELLKLTNIWKKRFGSVVAVVGEPFSLKQFYADAEKRRAEADLSLNLVTEDLGFAIVRRIMDCTAVSGTALTSAALLSMPDYSCSASRAVGRMISLLQVVFVSRGYVEASNWNAYGMIAPDAAEAARLVFGAGLEEKISHAPLAEALTGVLNHIESFELVSSEEQGDSRTIEVPIDRRLGMEYYKHNIMHLLVSASAVSFAARVNRSVEQQELYSFHQLLKPAFLFPFWREWRGQLEEALTHFAAAGWVEKSADFSLTEEQPRGVCVVTPVGEDMLSPTLRLVLPYFEAWYAGLQTVSQLSWESQPEAEFMADLKQMLHDGVGFAVPPRFESAASTMIEFSLACLLQEGVIRSERNVSEGSNAPRLFAINPAKQSHLEQQLARVRQILLEVAPTT